MSHGKTSTVLAVIASIVMVDIEGVPHKTILVPGKLIGPSRAGLLLPMPFEKALARWDTRGIVSSVSHGCVLSVFAVVADKILSLPRELKAAELASVLRVSWDLLFAANPELLPDLHAGRQISLGKDAP
jgi:hypothetical protein